MSDPQENPEGHDPLGGGVGDDSPVDGGNPAIGPDATRPDEDDRGSGTTSANANGDVPPRGFPEQ